MADDIRNELQKRREEIKRMLANGGDVTMKDLGWIMFSMAEDMSRIVEMEENCDARKAYANGAWWRTKTREKLLTWVLSALGAIILWILVSMIQAKTLLPLP